jgi:uroporphyrinogen III methyltransferase/synthase
VTQGIASLVGAGPGDPGLLTLRAKRLLERAEVVIYDYLCNPELLQWAPRSAEVIYAGKSGGDHTLTQDKINALIVDRVRAGRRVVRLKGGDPFVFGRGGEEAEELVAAGLPFEIVPGISSAIAAPAYAGIPITHRAFASSFTVLTGHEEPGKEASALDWEALTKHPGTKVILMGVERLRSITERFIVQGADPAMPIALIRWGTWGRQETLAATLNTIADLADARGFKAPAVAILGGVVGLRAKLNWFETRPLFGRRVVVTRTRAQASVLTEGLRELGADVLEIPTIQIEPQPFTPEQEAVSRDFASKFDWLVFTSPNGVEIFFERFLAAAGDVRKLGEAKIAVVGPATAAKVRERGLAVALQPRDFTSEALGAAFAPDEVQGKRFCLPRGNLAEPGLAAHLRRLGGEVDEWTIYHTTPPTAEVEGRNDPRARFRAEGAHWITFASASAAEGWNRLGLVPDAGQPVPKIASIGPVTSRAVAALGGTVDVEAAEHTISGLLTTLLAAEASQ